MTDAATRTFHASNIVRPNIAFGRVVDGSPHLYGVVRKRNADGSMDVRIYNGEFYGTIHTDGMFRGTGEAEGYDFACDVYWQGRLPVRYDVNEHTNEIMNWIDTQDWIKPGQTALATDLSAAHSKSPEGMAA